MTRRPISDTWRAWLMGEMEIWRSGGLLSEQQMAQILDLYETPTDIARRKHSKALLALMSVASLLVGMAALLLIGYNWEAMPAAVKLAIIFGTIIGTYAAAFWFRYRVQASGLSQVFFFLGCLFYGCGIWLIAQVFHIQSHYPDGIWFWALGVLPFAVCLNAPLLHALLAALLGVWVGTEILDSGDILRPLLFGRWFHFPGACYSLPLLALPGLLLAYRKQSALTIAIYVPVLAWWAVLQPIAWEWHQECVYFVGAVGTLLLLIAESHRIRSRLAIPYRLYGALLTAGVLVPLSFVDFQREVLGHWEMSAGLVSGLIVLALGASAVAAVAEVKLRFGLEEISRLEAWGRVLGSNWLPLALLGLMAGLAASRAGFAVFWHGGYASSSPLSAWSMPVALPALLCNAAMVVLAVWLMHVGLREDRGRPFAAGVLYFLLWAVLRYIDLFGHWGGMLGAALMFFLCGATLFGIARFWHHRKGVAHE
jgi:uncharacterized membrane protein